MGKRYGVPYMGSKNKIAEWLIDKLPSSEVFVDLFAGGCAVTHAAIESGKYQEYIINDIGPAPDLFIDAIHGKYKDETRWISREDFFRLKDVDPYVRYCWSFGNKADNYLYGKELEPWKKALHYARVFGDYSLLKDMGIDTTDASCKWIKDNDSEIRTTLKATGKSRLYDLQSLESLKSLESLRRLQRLQRLQSLERLYLNITATHKDYREVQNKRASFFYADPPYRGTTGYSQDFDFDAFDKWLETVDKPVIVSEYTQPPHTTEVASIEKCVFLNQTKKGKKTERLFIQDRYYDWYKEAMRHDRQGDTTAEG